MSDVSTLMTGFPSAPVNQVSLANWRTAPYCSWAFHHVRELLPTANIACNRNSTRQAGPADYDAELNRLKFTGFDGAVWTLEQTLKAGSTDAFMVVKNERVLSEQYFNGQQADDPHVIFSVTKSVMGVLTGIMAERGIIDPMASVISYIPEASHSAWKDCTVRHLLDMTVAVEFDEDCLDLDGDVARYRRATGWDPPRAGEQALDLRQYLLTIASNGKAHGEVFHYVSPNTDFLGWILERITQQPLAKLISEYLWRPMGARSDAYLTVDMFGAPRAAGGLCITLSDMACFAAMELNCGRSGEVQVIPQSWLDDIHHNGDPVAWQKGMFKDLLPNGNYRSFWYQTGNANKAFCAIGIHGQWIYCDPVTDVVIVRQASQGLAVDEPYDMTYLLACEAISNFIDQELH